MVKIHSRYDLPPSPTLTCPEVTRTQQHFKDECDLNAIVKRAISTGDVSIFTNSQRAEFYDVSAFTDYQAAQEMLSDVRSDFSSLPSAVRRQFSDNPDKYVAFMSDPANYAKAVELGLLEGGDVAPPKEVTASAPNPSEDSSKTPSGDALKPSGDA